MCLGTGNGNRESGSTKKTTHDPRPATHRVKEGFTLVELLVVLLLMGIVYAIVFNNFLPNPTQKREHTLSLREIRNLFETSGLFRKNEMTLYGVEGAEAYLVSEGRILRKFHLRETAEAYRLNPDETLQAITFPHIKIGSEEFVPLYAVRCRTDGLLDPGILAIGERWLYIHPFDSPRIFENASDMVAYIRRTDYLPDKAGYAQ